MTNGRVVGYEGLGVIREQECRTMVGMVFSSEFILSMMETLKVLGMT